MASFYLLSLAPQWLSCLFFKFSNPLLEPLAELWATLPSHVPGTQEPEGLQGDESIRCAEPHLREHPGPEELSSAVRAGHAVQCGKQVKIANEAALRKEAPGTSAQTTVPLAACSHAANNVVCGSWLLLWKLQWQFLLWLFLCLQLLVWHLSYLWTIFISSRRHFYVSPLQVGIILGPA